MSDYINKSAVIELIESKMTDGCLGTEDETFVGGHGLVDDISDLPTLDEKEIIRKAFERVVERLEKESEIADNELKRTIERNPMQTDFALGYKMAIKNAIKIIKIVKEECGIGE